MIISYLKTFLRNLWKQKGYSFINILGLSLGLACSILIFLWVRDEVSYDRFHENSNRLFLVVQNQHFKTRTITVSQTPAAIAFHLKKDYPEIVEAARVYEEGGVMKYQDKIFPETLTFVDPSFFEMFTFPLAAGDPQSAFPDISSVVLTEKMARKYFQHENPIGKIITMNDKFDLKVTGVLKNIPRQSSLQISFLIPFGFLKNQNFNFDAWGLSNLLTFVQLQKNVSYKNVSEKIFDLFRRYKSKRNIRDIFLHPVVDWHLYAVDGSGGLIIFVVFFSIIALFVLIIACINFINLSTGRTATRAREIGIRKVVGASRITLIKQFFGESGLMVVAAVILAIFWTMLVLPAFNEISRKQLTLDIFAPDVFLTLIGIALFTCLLAGSYPALLLSSFPPANILSGRSKSRGRKGHLRKLLVFVQFSISVFLIISTTVIYKQLYFVKTRDLGMDKKNIIHIPISQNIGRKYLTLKNEWLKNPNILNVTLSSHLPLMVTEITGGWDWEGENSDGYLIMGFGLFGYDYTDTFKIPMVQGRFFSEDFAHEQAVVVNEKAVEAMGMKAPVGKRLSQRGLGKDFTIIGVVKDFHFLPLHHKIRPLVMIHHVGMVSGSLVYRHIYIRVKPINIEDTIAYVKNTYEKIIPGYLFDYSFLEDDIDDLYQIEQKIGRLTGSGAFLAVFISCLGLLGLTFFMVEQRTNEIAVRKVFGASTTAIIKLLLKEFTRLILAASALAGIIAYLVMNRFLQFYASRTHLSWWIFVGTAAFSLGIAVLIVGFQTINVASKNPVDSLNYE
ncbi:MAG: ABC transporter permease [Candidatus Aminicenantes bacterium]|jgi:putative ABC transport system permease protein